jgi:hypothetical protein
MHQFFAEKTEIKSLGPAIPLVVISQSSTNRIETSVRKFHPGMYDTERKLLSDCAERNALLSILINHKIILAPALP